MTTLFEKYELQRKRYSPGVYWRDTPMGFHTIKELVIVPESQVKGKYVRKLFNAGDPSNNVTFMVTISNDSSGEHLGPGEYVSWSKDYMESNYEPGNFTPLHYRPSRQYYHYETV